MKPLSHTDFEIVSCQATIFTPDEEFSSAKIMRDFYPRWAELFDADPTVFPPFPGGVPGEVPRIILQSQGGMWRCEIASARVNLFWRRTTQETSPVALGAFFAQASAVLHSYQHCLGPRIGRLAAVLTRFAQHDSPALLLAHHFCRDRWREAPLNRPESFELHAHKRFLLGGTFQVNSWARSKTGHLMLGDKHVSVVVFEQDINTLAEEAPTKSFSVDEIGHFWRVVTSEFDVILKLYYPKAEGE